MYAWIDGRLKFAEYKVNDTYCFSEAEKDKLIARSDNPAVEVLEQDPELIAKCEGKTFKNFSEAKAFIESGCPKSELEVLRETIDTLIISALEV